MTPRCRARTWRRGENNGTIVAVKRKVAIAFLSLVLLLIAGTLAAMRTRWVGDRMCAIAAARLRAATGVPIALGSCRINPFRLEFVAEGVRLGPAAAPMLEADAIRARLAPVQALGKRIDLDELSAVRPRVVLSLPPSPPGSRRAACPPPVLAQLDLHHLRIENGSLDLRLPGGERIVVSRFDIRSAPSTMGRSLRSLATKPSSDVAMELGPALVEAAGRKFHVSGAHVQGEVVADLSRVDLRAAELDAEGLRVEARGEIRDLCAPMLDIAVTATGRIPAYLALLGRSGARAEGGATVEVELTGSARRLGARGQLRFHGARIGKFVPGDARAAFHLSGKELAFDRIEVPFAEGVALASGAMRLDRALSVSADVEVRDVEFGEILSRLGVPGSWVMMRDSAHVRLAGHLLPLELTGEGTVDVRDFHVLRHSWEQFRLGDPGVLDFDRAHVEAGLRVTREAIRLERARVQVGEATLAADADLPIVSGRGFRIDFDGDVDLAKIEHIAGLPLAGRATVRGMIAAPGGYGVPVAAGSARVQSFRFMRLDLGELSSQISYERPILRFDAVEGLKGETRYRGAVAVDLSSAPARLDHAHVVAEGRMRDLFDAVMPWQPGARRIREVLDGSVQAEATASGAVTRLDAAFDARIGRGRLFDREFDGGRVKGHVVGGARAEFEVAELRRGKGSTTASGWIGLQPEVPWDLRFRFAGLRLADLELPVGPIAGSASGSATLSGSAEKPKLRFAVNGDGVAVGEVPVGSVQVGGSLVGARLALTGSAEGARFSGTAQLEGDLPFEARADFDFDDITRFISRGSPAGLQAAVTGEATAAGALADLRNARAVLRITRLRGSYGDFHVDNPAPVVVSVAGGRIEIDSLALRGANTELTLSGSRAPDGSLDLSASGSLDLRLLGGLVPQVTRSRGQLTLEAHIGGTASDPLLVGAGQVRDGGFQIGDLPIVFGALNGELAFSQNRVLFDHLAATLNGGGAEMRGQVELSRFVPVRLRIDASLDEVPWSIPANVPITVAGPLSVSGTPDALTITGRLHVVRALYTERVELEKSLLEFRHRRAVAPRTYEKSADWLRYDLTLSVDGDARIDNDLVHGGIRGEMQVTGNLGAVGLVGTLAMTEGSRATFRGNEFTLSHAVMDFTDRNRVRAALDVHGEAAVRDYQVFMHLFGTLDEPQLQLTSSPPLSQQDVLTLLSLGFTTRDAAATGGVGGAATAAAAQALFSVSGLDDQVKRFLPHDGPLKDFSVRMTTAYSEGSGQVEPRAEFESKVLRDRLRLRYQAPLSGARGQKAQAELRLSDRSSLQYQWDNDNPDVAAGGDHGVDLKLRWEWSD